ncbi:hypothetical protein PCE1_004167 [Barthelona sp. PCE]
MSFSVKVKYKDLKDTATITIENDILQLSGKKINLQITRASISGLSKTEKEKGGKKMVKIVFQPQAETLRLMVPTHEVEGLMSWCESKPQTPEMIPEITKMELIDDHPMLLQNVPMSSVHRQDRMIVATGSENIEESVPSSMNHIYPNLRSILDHDRGLQKLFRTLVLKEKLITEDDFFNIYLSFTHVFVPTERVEKGEKDICIDQIQQHIFQTPIFSDYLQKDVESDINTFAMDRFTKKSVSSDLNFLPELVEKTVSSMPKGIKLHDFERLSAKLEQCNPISVNVSSDIDYVIPFSSVNITQLSVGKTSASVRDLVKSVKVILHHGYCLLHLGAEDAIVLLVECLDRYVTLLSEEVTQKNTQYEVANALDMIAAFKHILDS